MRYLIVDEGPNAVAGNDLVNFQEKMRREVVFVVVVVVCCAGWPCFEDFPPSNSSVGKEENDVGSLCQLSRSGANSTLQ